jgi:hypothetical protein
LALIFFAEHDVSAFYIPDLDFIIYWVSFVGGKKMEKHYFGISGLVSGLVCFYRY